MQNFVVYSKRTFLSQSASPVNPITSFNHMARAPLSHHTPNSQQPFTQHPFIPLCFQDITLSSHTASVLKATKCDLIKLKPTIWGNAFNAFWSNLQLGHLSLVLPTAGREQGSTRAQPKPPAGEEEGRWRHLQGAPKRPSQAQGPFCATLSQYAPCLCLGAHSQRESGTCRQAAPLPVDLLLKTGMEGWGPSWKWYHFALSQTLAAHTGCHTAFAHDTDVT